MVSALRVLLALYVFFVTSVTATGTVSADLPGSACALPSAEEDNVPKSLLTGDGDDDKCDDGGLLPAPIRVAAIIAMGLMAGGTLAVPHPTSSAILLSF